MALVVIAETFFVIFVFTMASTGTGVFVSVGAALVAFVVSSTCFPVVA